MTNRPTPFSIPDVSAFIWMHTRTRARAHAQTGAHTHSRTLAHTHTHGTHTHTHTHTSDSVSNLPRVKPGAGNSERNQRVVPARHTPRTPAVRPVSLTAYLTTCYARRRAATAGQPASGQRDEPALRLRAGLLRHRGRGRGRTGRLSLPAPPRSGLTSPFDQSI